MRLSTRLRSSCVFGTALTVLGACSKGSAYTDSAQGTLAPAAPAPRDTTAATTAAAAAPGRDSARRMVPRKHGPLPPRAANALSEADVQDVIDVINGVDAQLSNPAVQKASNPQVKRFANELARTHRQRVTDRPVPVDNPSAAALVAPLRALQTEAANRLGSLASGSAFDHAYVDALVSTHERALAVLDSVAARATDGDLPAVVSQMRTQVTQHLDEARALQRRLP